MQIRKPESKELFSYIIATHKADHIDVQMPHIQKALKKEAGLEGVERACVEGHFAAINYIMTLIPSVDFPAKDPSLLTNEFTLHNALYWLRELHVKMMYPIAEFGKFNGTGQLHIQSNQVGTYRYNPKMLAFAPAPDPTSIPKILGAWLKEITTLDAEIKDKVDNPYGLTPQQGNQMIRTVKESSLFLSCLQPFEDGNNRIAKLVENALRMRWLMPWRIIYGIEQESYNRELTGYQSDKNGFLRWLQ